MGCGPAQVLGGGDDVPVSRRTKSEEAQRAFPR